MTIPNPSSSAAEAVLLFAHGSRDATWAAPFERLRARVSARGVPVELAYLERMTPDLATAVAALGARGITAVVVVPVFLGQGGHVRADLPALVHAAQQAHPHMALRLAPPIGEDDRVLAVIADVCVEARGLR